MMRNKFMSLMVCTCLLVTVSACGSFGLGISTPNSSVNFDTGNYDDVNDWVPGLDGLWQAVLFNFSFDVFNYVASSIADDLANGDVADQFSPEQSYYIGRGVSAALINSYGIADPNNRKTAEQLQYLNEMAGYLAYNGLFETALWSSITVGILETSEVCAFSTPGGYIWISRGAISLCENEDQLAAILAHELGHAAYDHAIKAYGNDLRPNPWIRNLDMLSPLGINFGALIGSLAEQIVENGYGEDQEFEADEWGALTLFQSGYSANAMVSLLKQVERYEQKSPTPGKYLANHPDIEDRIDEIEDLISEKPALALSVTSKGKSSRTARFKVIFR
ncbi:MAG: M48 family metallopeptidase [Planctomycetota bacterium]